MRGTLLQPGPALVYLVVLLSLLGFWLRDALVGGDRRGEPAAVPAASLTVDPGAALASDTLELGAGPTVVRFAGVAPAEARVRVELSLDGAPGRSADAHADAAGDVVVVVRPGRLPPGMAAELVVTADGEVVARRPFVWPAGRRDLE